MGEIASAIEDGTQEALMPFITSANIACGGHAGDDRTMASTIRQAVRWKVAIGAHPSYPDRAHFGRRELHLPAKAVADSVFEQVRALARIAKAEGARLRHVKAHGALYNQAARDPALARAIAEGVAGWDQDLILVGLAGSEMLNVFRDAGFRVAAEAFADRRYEEDGSLRSRAFQGALIEEPEAAAEQALGIVDRRSVTAASGKEVPVHADTICIHGDRSHVVKIAEAVALRLRQRGVVLRSL